MDFEDRFCGWILTIDYEFSGWTLMMDFGDGFCGWKLEMGFEFEDRF